MQQPVLLPVQMAHVVTADRLAATLFIASISGKNCSPKVSTLEKIRARARAVRPL